MAARIFREGIHALASETNGIQVGQWIFTGRPFVPASEAEIVHIEDFTHAGSSEVFNDSNFVGDGEGDATGELPEGNRILRFQDDEGGDWENGDIIDLRGSTSGNDFVIAEVRGVRGEYTRLEVQEALSIPVSSPTETNIGVNGNIVNRLFTNQRLVIDGVTYIVTNFFFNTGSRRTDITITNLDGSIIPNSGGTVNTSDLVGETAVFLREATLFVYPSDMGSGRTNQLTGDITFVNVSQLEEGEHFSFYSNSPANGPLYLTGGPGHYLIVPEGLEITANTLSA